MTFHGWTDAILDFYEGLEADNTKTYWQEHKQVYDEQVLEPMKELLGELTDEFGEPKIFRPNRDIRFSADKTPYKTQIGATLSGHGYCRFPRMDWRWPAAPTPLPPTSWLATAAP
jgi:uncharacterized protein (DUF2461 family)